MPGWHDLVKTATYKELCPQDPDWYYVRAAAVCRKIYLRGGIGVGAFQKIYGGSKSNGSRRPHFAKAAAGLHRNILQALTEIDLVAKKKDKKSDNSSADTADRAARLLLLQSTDAALLCHPCCRGRWITRSGQRELDTIASQLVAARKQATAAALAAQAD